MLNPTDHRFLHELARQLDETPTARVTGRAVGQAADIEPDAVKATVERLKQRGLIGWSPAPARLGSGLTHRGLSVTPEGYRLLGG